MKGRIKDLTFLGFLLIFVVCLVLLKMFIIQKILHPQPLRQIYLGVWAEGLWNNQTKTLNTAPVIQFEKNISKKVAIVNYFRGWDELDDPQVVNDLNQLSSHGWVPMVSTNPYLTTKCASGAEDLYTSIAEGQCDFLIHTIAKTLTIYGKPLFLRFAWEMNINSNPWSVEATYSNPPMFIKAWQHMHDVFVADGVTNVQWIFSVNVESSSTVPITSLYPGDAYADWTGIDGYNYGTTQSWSRWVSFDEVFHNTYAQMVSIAPSKPIMISEFNSVSQGGDKVAWLNDALKVQIPKNYPQLKAIVFFNEDKRPTEGVDWRMEISADVLQTLRKNLQNPIYVSTINTDRK